MILHLNDLKISERQNWLQHAIAPRPIGLVSTIDKEGRPNLAPFSFFNLVSANPPLVIFSPARRVRDNTTKHSLENLYDVREAVVHIVTYNMVQQVSLASCDYAKGADEFLKAGFTKEPAIHVKPFMVKESPVKLECKINEIKPLGKEGGAGNLIIAEVLCMHIDEHILNDSLSMIDQTRLLHVARLGGDWYCRVTNESLFKVAKPNAQLGIGFDKLPQYILDSRVLTANDLAQLANSTFVPDCDPLFKDERSDAIKVFVKGDKGKQMLHQYVKELIENGEVDKAWQVLLSDQKTADL
ncbi:MAG: flavin reductase family protein [Chitinophagaceae bacterium]